MNPNVSAPTLPVPPDNPDWIAPPLPNLDDVVIDDGKPVESIFVERQQHLLVDPLEVSWQPPPQEPVREQEQPGTFLALTNVGFFFKAGEAPLVPDFLLSLGVQPGADMTRKENRSYFLWVIGKPPDLVIEIVSDRRGDELSYKKSQYARLGVSWYVVFDPAEWLGSCLRSFRREGRVYQEQKQHWFSDLGLGLTLWEGTYRHVPGCYLRWCDEKGVVLPTGQELAAQMGQQLEQTAQQLDLERQRRERLEQRLRELGIEP